LWKFAGTIDGGFALLTKYLLFLTPFVYLQLVQSATLIAVLATYVIKSRQNEIVTWISAGQSVYRLLVPCFVLAFVVGLVSFGIQEWIAPPANVRQDEIRTQLRKGGALTNNSGRFWVALDRRIYSFELGPRDDESGVQDTTSPERGSLTAGKGNLGGDRAPLAIEGRSLTVRQGNNVDHQAVYPSASRRRYHSASDNEGPSLSGLPMFAFIALNITAASDNETRPACLSCVRDLVIYEFSQDGARLQTVYRARSASWIGETGRVSGIQEALEGKRRAPGTVRLEGEVLRSDLSMEGITTAVKEAGRELAEEANPFEYVRGKPSHLTVGELRSRVSQTESEVELNSFRVAIHRRYSTLLMPLVIALFTAPFALSLSRKGKAVTIGYAVGLWLVFIAVGNVFSQFGDAGALGPGLAVWAPMLIFSMLGVFLLARVRT
jgi:lipopolysaccharide export LptBFGC system permease protein LptF